MSRLLCPLFACLLPSLCLSQQSPTAADDPAFDAFIRCALVYGKHAVAWDAAPSDIAEASISFCGTKEQDLKRSVKARLQLDEDEAQKMVDRLVNSARRAVIQLVLEERNEPKK